MYHRCDSCGCVTIPGTACAICESAKGDGREGDEPQATAKAPLIVPRSFSEGRTGDALHVPSFVLGILCGVVIFSAIYLYKNL